MIKELLKRAMARTTRRRATLEPDAERPPLEEAMRALILELVSSVETERTAQPRGPLWIFKPVPVDAELFIQAAMVLLEEAREKGRADAFVAAEVDEDECSCRCRTHHKFACRLCLRVESCQRHGV